MHLNQWISFAQTYQNSFLYFLSEDPLKRIKDIAIDIFSKFSHFVKSFNNQSKEINNTKTIAMIGCLSLIAIFVISLLRRRNARFVPHPTPMKDEHKKP
jgi:hypothetical protein